MHEGKGGQGGREQVRGRARSDRDMQAWQGQGAGQRWPGSECALLPLLFRTKRSNMGSTEPKLVGLRENDENGHGGEGADGSKAGGPAEGVVAVWSAGGEHEQGQSEDRGHDRG